MNNGPARVPGGNRPLAPIGGEGDADAEAASISGTAAAPGLAVEGNPAEGLWPPGGATEGGGVGIASMGLATFAVQRQPLNHAAIKIGEPADTVTEQAGIELYTRSRTAGIGLDDATDELLLQCNNIRVRSYYDLNLETGGVPPGAAGFRVRVDGSPVLTDISGGATGRALFAAADVAAARAALGLPDIIESRAVTAEATLTTPTWAPNAYEKIEIEFKGRQSASSYWRFRANADTGSKYIDTGVYFNSSPSATVYSSPDATRDFADVAISNSINSAFSFKLTFYPMTDGAARTGRMVAESFLPGGTITNCFGTDVRFAYTDVVTDVTFLTLFSHAGATLTGRLTVKGYRPLF